VAALAGGVAHELNNMIAVILGHAAFVLDEGSASPSAIVDIQQIIKAAERAAAVTRQLLAFSSHSLYRPEVVDLGVALRETEGSLRGLLGPAHRLELRLEGTSSARIDVEQLAQVIQHLVANARDATPHGGHLVISTTTAQVDEPIPATGERMIPPGRYGKVTVQDDGIGIDPAVQPRIFEPFFTTKPLGEGTGLGLAAVQGILTQNDGFITVESEPGSSKISRPIRATRTASAALKHPAVFGSNVYRARSRKSRIFCPRPSYRRSRRTATVMQSVPDNSSACCIASNVSYLPVPTISRLASVCWPI
jgi:signal transduction histidine kinase